MPTAAEGGIDLEAPRGRHEHRHDLLCQHRDVPYLHLSSTPRRSDPERTLEAHVVELDPKAFEGPGQLVGVLEPLGVRRPGGRDPDLGVIA